MNTLDGKMNCDVFSPQEYSREELAISTLLHRITTLPTEALADLASLSVELVKCESREAYQEITNTIRELMFPELVGGLREDFPTSRLESLVKRSEWIGNRIKAKRQAANMTQNELAEKAGIPQSHVSRIEQGHLNPSQKTLEKLANALSVDISDIDYM